MREVDEALIRARESHIRQTDGQAIDPKGYATIRTSKETERAVMSLPVSRQGDTSPAQDPATGRFFYMVDYDELDSAPLS